MKKVLELMSAEQLEQLKDDDGLTALHEAAIFGNVSAAECLVRKNRNLLYVKDGQDHAPLYLAAHYGHKEMVSFMLPIIIADQDHPDPFADIASGVELLCLFIIVGFYDLALDVIHSYPELSKSATLTGDTPLKLLAKQRSWFNAGFGNWLPPGILCCITYKFIKVKLENCSHHPRGDIENQNFNSNWIHPLRSLTMKVPRLKNLAALKLQRYESLKLAECLCMELEAQDLNFSEVSKIYGEAIHMGIKYGNLYMVRLIVNKFPSAIWLCDEDNRNPLQAAVLYRSENIFKFLYRISDNGCLGNKNLDNYGNNILHLAGIRAPDSQQYFRFGAALEMQRELLWFQAVKKVVQPSFKEALNNDKKTPFMVFSEEHRELAKQGEKWIKATANYCTVVATLIATVTFAAQITLPGGNNNGGLPILMNKTAFQLFTIFNGCSLITSTVAIGVFLSIVTAGCPQLDFHHYLPQALVVGFLTLFSSITTMLLAFSCTILLLLMGESEHFWGIIPIFIALSFFPAILFVSLQLPVLRCTIQYTFGTSILGPRR